jgi:two-component system, OmpR family, phosphate regulon response regulator PhoB
MEMQTILIIEDEIDIAELISFNLERNQYIPAMAHDGQSGIDKAFKILPNLIILDLMLPKKDGFTVYKELRNDKRTMRIPVLILTAKAQTEDRIAGLEIGADDYLTKPFSPKELILRIKSILKRHTSYTSEATSSLFECPPFKFNKSTLQLFADNKLIDLTVTEFKLMLHLCERANAPQDRYNLLKEVWGYHDDVNSRTLDTHMKRLRQKIGTHANLIETVRGIGYQIVSQ